MIDFKTINIEVNNRELTNIERNIEGYDAERTFHNAGVLSGRGEVSFDTNIKKASTAIKSFHFETKDDHNLKKLKLELREVIKDNNKIIIDVEGVFMDNSPEDDYVNKPFIISASVLVIVDRE